MKLYRNNKNQRIYHVLDKPAIDCTNSRDGTLVIIYTSVDGRDNNKYVREEKEFHEKFTALTDREEVSDDDS